MTASYSYTGDGLRVSKTVGGTTTSYTWDPTGPPVVVGDGNEYVWGRGLISQMTAATGKSFVHADGSGSVRLLTDAAGTVVGTQQYDAFGAARTQTGAQLAFGYTGEQVDAESGLVYLRARYYDPGSGRFLSRDLLAGMLAAPASQHRYAYVSNNPLTWVDPTGAVQIATPDGFGGGGAGGTIALGAAAAGLTSAVAAAGGTVAGAVGHGLDRLGGVITRRGGAEGDGAKSREQKKGDEATFKEATKGLTEVERGPRCAPANQRSTRLPVAPAVQSNGVGGCVPATAGRGGPASGRRRPRGCCAGKGGR